MANQIKMPKCSRCGSDSHWMRQHDIINKAYFWECWNWIVTYDGACAHGEQMCNNKITKEERKRALANVL